MPIFGKEDETVEKEKIGWFDVAEIMSCLVLIIRGPAMSTGPLNYSVLQW